MTTDPDNPTGLSASILEEVDRICLAFEQAWCQQKRPCVRQFLDRGNEETRSALLHELLLLDIYYRTRGGEQPRVEEYETDFPKETSAIEAAFDAGPSDTVDGRKKQATELTQFVLPQDQPMPSRLGRYRIDERIGVGGCGAVYRAYDEQLQRFVAVKIPHRDRFANALAKEMFLKEARLLATLSHSGIVPVHDVGFTEDATCFIVSQYIDGGNLADYVASHLVSAEQAARIVLRIAEALHSAHVKGFVHRDVKLSNILRDTEGNLYIADFGLALSEEDLGTGAGFAGTPTNMSPEQARGEGHLVDGRTDIYGLGVVLYELLSQQRPFDSRDVASLLEQIERREPKPLRQINDQIPKELERICLKCLSKRPSDRYSTAMDLADDLRNWEPHLTDRDKVADSPCPVIPKGLRSFDEQDGEFILQLLPGPHDREGLPGIIRFWKARVTETTPERTFRVGVIYGPSGCGKSSLVKAALLPRVAGVSQAIYLPASADQTESRLYAAIADKLRMKGWNATSPQDNRLVNMIKRVRRDLALSARALPDCAIPPESLGSRSAPPKVLIMIDQFEQWLHAHADPKGTELVAALRQCDGQHVQCILLVRDDFWMPLTRFMGELEIPLVEHDNATAVDLFEREHARKVLVLLGRAHGRLPNKDSELNAQHVRFIDNAVSTIEEQGRVIPVRLSLMVEMLKARRWEPATLAGMGGTQGLGTQFLEHTFHSPSALPAHRHHQQAARRVLQELLPEPGVDLTVHHRSWLELFEASGYDDDPTRFEDLLRILDHDMRLITPTDQTADQGIVNAEDEKTIQAPDQSHRRYQLTHDYLVPSIREWLWGQQRETTRGRAQNLLGGTGIVMELETGATAASRRIRMAEDSIPHRSQAMDERTTADDACRHALLPCPCDLRNNHLRIIRWCWIRSRWPYPRQRFGACSRKREYRRNRPAYRSSSITRALGRRLPAFPDRQFGGRPKTEMEAATGQSFRRSAARCDHEEDPSCRAGGTQRDLRRVQAVHRRANATAIHRRTLATYGKLPSGIESAVTHCLLPGCARSHERQMGNRGATDRGKTGHRTAMDGLAVAVATSRGKMGIARTL